jgi:hypothetical protein
VPDLIYPVRVGPLSVSSAATCPSRFYRFASRLGAIRLGAGEPDYVPLSVETRNKYWTVVRIAAWLVRTDERWLAALTKLRGTSAKLNRVICTEERKANYYSVRQVPECLRPALHAFVCPPIVAGMRGIFYRMP